MGVVEEFKRDVSEPFYQRYASLVEAEGYSMTLGMGKKEKDGPDTLMVLLSPQEGSPDPIGKDLLERLTEELPDEFNEALVIIEYIGIIVAL